MRQVIYKHCLDRDKVGEIQTLQLYKDPTIIAIAEQEGQIMLWAQYFAPIAGYTMVDFILIFTGLEYELSAGFCHIGTVQVGSFVYHVFSRLSN